jgi:ABC-2 type transport system ATP-binding protein
MVIINKGATKVEGLVSDLLNAANLKVTFGLTSVTEAKILLGQTQWIKKVDSFTDNKIVFSINHEEIPLVNKLLVENNIDVNSIVPMRSLEEYFLDITEKSVA